MNMALSRAVFLDRDGVLNQVVVRDGRPYPPPSLDSMVLLPGVPEALAALRAADFRLVVVTNQPDVGAGRQSREGVERIHAWMRANLPLDDVRVCYHTDADGCACRKPQPGMLRDAAAAWNIDMNASFMVGDRWRDIDAGRAAGCRTIYVRGEHDEPQPADCGATVDSLLEASRFILSQSF